jgi:myosin III
MNVFFADTINNKKKTPYCVASSGNEFSVAHYTGKVCYDATNMAEKNRDFVPPEVSNHC